MIKYKKEIIVHNIHLMEIFLIDKKFFDLKLNKFNEIKWSNVNLYAIKIINIILKNDL